MSCPCSPYSQCCFLLSFCSCQIPISLQPCCMLEQTNIKFIIQKSGNSAELNPFSLTFSMITYPIQNGVSRKKDHRLSTRDRLQTHAMGDSSSPTPPTSLVSPAPKVKITTRLQYEIPKRHVNHVLRISPDR